MRGAVSTGLPPAAARQGLLHITGQVVFQQGGNGEETEAVLLLVG